MHVLKIDDITFTLPSAWNELSKKQLLNLARLTSQDIDLTRLRVLLLLLFTGLKLVPGEGHGNLYEFAYRRRRFILSSYDINFASDKLLALFKAVDEEKTQYVPDIRLTKNLIPSFRIRLTRFYGPADGLSNITLKEFIHAETYYEQMMLESGGDKTIDLLIAVLYRPGKKSPGDNRVPFDDYRINTNATKIARLHPNYKKAILFFYEGCKYHLSQLFPHALKRKGGTAAKNPVAFKSFMQLVDELANHQPDRKEPIRNELLYEVLDSVDRLALKNDELQKQRKNK